MTLPNMPQEELGRRALLVGAGCVVLAALGACGSQSPGADSKSPKPGDVLLAKAAVPVGGGALSPDGVLVLQLKASEFTAFSATCPHQNYLVRPPDPDGNIVCLGHQSRFRAADGSVIDGPALGGLRPIAIRIDGDNVVRA